jgi:nicotinamidase-related amidase
MANDLALLVIDMQQGLFEEGPYQPEKLLTQVKSLIADARKNNVPVIYVQHNEDPQWGGSLVAGKPGHDIHADIAPQSGEVIIQKYHGNAFEDTNLQAVLTEKGIKRLIICGMQTDECINASSRGAHALGYDVTLVGDAHTTGNSDKARQIIEDHNKALNEVAKVKPTSEITFA